MATTTLFCSISYGNETKKTDHVMKTVWYVKLEHGISISQMGVTCTRTWTVHLNGFSPEWVRKCTVSLDWVGNSFRHSAQGYLWVCRASGKGRHSKKCYIWAGKGRHLQGHIKHWPGQIIGQQHTHTFNKWIEKIIITCQITVPNAV